MSESDTMHTSAVSSSGWASMNSVTGSLMCSSSPSKMTRMLIGRWPTLRATPRRRGVHVQLALVVAGAARVQDVVLVPRLERRPDPLVERIGRLDVVVAVDQDGGLVRPGVEPVGGDHRVAAGIGQAGVVEADGREVVRDPLRCPAHLVLLGRIGADRFHPQELVEALEVLVRVLAQVGEAVSAPFSVSSWSDW